MTITNGYVTLDDVLAEVGGTGNPANDDRLEASVEAASRQIDDFTGRRFWQDAAPVVREFYTDDHRELISRVGQVVDISTAAGLIVQIDDGDDGTFNTTLNIGTQFVLTPPNALDDGEPHTGIRLVDSANWLPMSTSGRPGVRITARFGWPSIPEPVRHACLIQSVLLYKATDAAMGGLSFGDGAFMRVRSGLNPIAQSLVERYTFARVA